MNEELELNMLLDAAVLAKRLGVSKSTIRRMDASGKLPLPAKIGRSVRWNSTEISQWINYGCPVRTKWQTVWENLRSGILQQ